MTYLKEIKRGGRNLKRGQKNAKTKFYAKQKCHIYVPKDKREAIRTLSDEIFGTRNRATAMAYEMGIDYDEIMEMLTEAYQVKVSTLQEQINNARESHEARSTKTDDVTTTTESDVGSGESTDIRGE